MQYKTSINYTLFANSNSQVWFHDEVLLSWQIKHYVLRWINSNSTIIKSYLSVDNVKQLYYLRCVDGYAAYSIYAGDKTKQMRKFALLNPTQLEANEKNAKVM